MKTIHVLAILIAVPLLAGCPGKDEPAQSSQPETRNSGSGESGSGAGGGANAGVDPASIPLDQQIDDFVNGLIIDRSQSDWRKKLQAPPEFAFSDDYEYYWILETNKGNIKFRFREKTAPYHVSNFAYLSKLGFFDGLTFHRVMRRFMAQGGCPDGNGFGGPGYKYAGEITPANVHDVPFLASTANSGPGTDGSQFFITFVPTRMLDQKHTIFAHLVDGRSTVSRLEAATGPQGQETPTELLMINRARIEVKKKNA